MKSQRIKTARNPEKCQLQLPSSLPSAQPGSQTSWYGHINSTQKYEVAILSYPQQAKSQDCANEAMGYSVNNDRGSGKKQNLLLIRIEVRFSARSRRYQSLICSGKHREGFF